MRLFIALFLDDMINERSNDDMSSKSIDSESYVERVYGFNRADCHRILQAAAVMTSKSRIELRHFVDVNIWLTACLYYECAMMSL